MKIFLFLFGYVRVRLQGRELSRFIHLCSMHHIYLWDIQGNEENELFASVAAADVFRLCEPLRKTKSRLRIIEKTGLPFLIRRYRWKIAFGCSILFAIGLFFYLTSFIWTIHISGNSYLTESTIAKFLEEHHANVGSKISSVDTLYLEEELLSQFPEIIWVSVHIRGSALNITMKEQILLEQPKENTDTAAMNLIAPCDGLVERLFVRNGTAAVAAGDIVTKGTPLIYGWIPIYDDTGNQILSYETVKADGDVILTGTMPYQDRLPVRYQSRTWSETTFSYLTIGSAQGTMDLIPLFIKNSSYVTITRTKPVCLFGRITLPFVLNQKELRCYEEKNAVYQRKEAENLMQKRFFAYIKKLGEKGIQITGKNVIILKDKNAYSMEGELTFSYPATELQEADLPSLE